MSSPTPEQLEQQVQEDLVRLDSYRNQLAQLLQQHQLLAASRVDHARAQAALEGLERTDAGTEVLLPLGAEAFVRGQPDRSGPVLLGIGSGYVAELDRPRVLETIAQRTKQIDEAARELEGQIRAFEERIALLSRRVEALTQRPGGGGVGSPDDVGGD